MSTISKNKPYSFIKNLEFYTIKRIKDMGSHPSEDHLNKLLELFKQDLSIDLKREIASSIGRQLDDDIIYNFLKQEAFKEHYMEVVYQFLRTALYKSKDMRFAKLCDDLLQYYQNENMQKMKQYYDYRHTKKPPLKIIENVIKKPSLLFGDNAQTLNKIVPNSINLIFTSPPYYNARIYSDYKNYKDYLNAMSQSLKACFRVLEEGRFIIINVSPVITKRAGREFESVRYPIHFDFHQILIDNGFYFVDEILWIKPDFSVPNRIGGYLQNKKPLGYKPNCVSESLLVYRKKAPFLLDKNIKIAEKRLKPSKQNNTLFGKKELPIETTNCWYITPKSSKDHPAVFPESLCERVLNYYSFENEVVCDPFAGSGTFGMVAKSMGRIPLLCEQHPKYAQNLIKLGFKEI